MSHRCAKCGREYPDASFDILQGCSCGSRKFFYETGESHPRKAAATKERSLPKKEQPPVAASPPEQEDEDEDGEDRFNRVESIRIVSPGTYELNIEKLAHSDERVVSLGKGSYAVDLLSMVKSRKAKKENK